MIFSIAKREVTFFSGTARSKGSSVTLPAALLVPSTSLIWSEVQYSYTPTVGYIVTGTLTLKDQIYMRPRLSDTVTGPSSCRARWRVAMIRSSSSRCAPKWSSRIWTASSGVTRP